MQALTPNNVCMYQLMITMCYRQFGLCLCFFLLALLQLSLRPFQFLFQSLQLFLQRLLL